MLKEELPTPNPNWKKTSSAALTVSLQAAFNLQFNLKGINFPPNLLFISERSNKNCTAEETYTNLTGGKLESYKNLIYGKR